MSNRSRQKRASLPVNSTPPRLPELAIEHRPIGQLKAYARNARTHSEQQIRHLATSITRFGFVSPIIIDEADVVVAGHGRLAAARRLGLSNVPTVRLSHLNDAQIRALRLADNRLAELAGWDKQLLAIELQELATLDLGFEVEDFGFTAADLSFSIDDPKRAARRDPLDILPAPLDSAVSRLGDLWLLGGHRLLCGSALDAGNYRCLLNGERVRTVVTDLDQSLSSFNPSQAPEGSQDGEAALVDGITTLLDHLSAVVEDGGLIYAGVPWPRLYALQTAARATDLTAEDLCVWKHGRDDADDISRGEYGLVLVLKTGTAPGLFPDGRCRRHRHRTNMWTYAGVDDPTTPFVAKPVALVTDVITDSSQPDDLVLVPFCRTGTALIAAEVAGRYGVGLESDPQLVDVAVRRWQAVTGRSACHADTGETFDAVAARRGELS